MSLLGVISREDGRIYHRGLEPVGADTMWQAVMPREMFLARVAKKLIRHHRLSEVSPGQLTFSLAREDEIYEVLDLAGHVRLVKPSP